jgi:GMP synthase-like glutamine amidotransferase
MSAVGSDGDARARRRILIVEHESDSGAVMLGDRAEALGYELEVVTPEAGIPQSSAGSAAVVVMGASPGVNDAHIQSWFADELALLRDAHQRNVPVLGVCFGAQALAVALGGRVTPAREAEIGWFTVETCDASLVEAGPWFEWHVDAITPPPGAAVVARSRVCVQAYTIGRHLGVQFHPEVTQIEVGSWAAGEQEVLDRIGLSAEDLVAETRERAAEARARADRLFDRFLLHAGLA